jgi:heme-degrading monooxygenase HmoA
VFARVTTFSGPAGRIEEGLEIFRASVLPWLRDATGFRGFTLLIDPANEKALTITFWTTREAAMDTTGSGGSSIREEVAASVGTVMESTEIYELAATESLSLEED